MDSFGDFLRNKRRKFISNTDLQRMLSIIKLSFHNYFID